MLGNKWAHGDLVDHPRTNVVFHCSKNYITCVLFPFLVFVINVFKILEQIRYSFLPQKYQNNISYFNNSDLNNLIIFQFSHKVTEGIEFCSKTDIVSGFCVKNMKCDFVGEDHLSNYKSGWIRQCSYSILHIYYVTITCLHSNLIPANSSYLLASF